MRKLGDYAFMLRDYKFAHSIYDMLRKDLNGNEKGLKYYAGAQVKIDQRSPQFSLSRLCPPDTFLNQLFFVPFEGFRKCWVFAIYSWILVEK